MRWRRALLLAALAPIGWLLQFACSFVPELTERIYSRGVYPKIRHVLNAVAQLSPIAIGETLLLIAVGWALVRVMRGGVAWRRRLRSLRNLLAHAVAKTLAIGGVLFLLFQAMWALNHARLPFATQVGLQTRPVGRAELIDVVRKLAVRAAAIRPEGLDPLHGLPGHDYRAAVAAAYARAGTECAALRGPAPVIREPLISPLMTLASITGIYSPFTAEANVDGEVPRVVLPFTAAHEVAHQRGYAREDEANFIAWWVGSRSDDPLLAYSCELCAWRTALAQLAAVDGMAYFEERGAAPKAIRDDDRAIRDFWLGRPKAVTQVLTKITSTTNDVYLRSSGHKEGVESYDRMVDLLIAALCP